MRRKTLLPKTYYLRKHVSSSLEKREEAGVEKDETISLLDDL